MSKTRMFPSACNSYYIVRAAPAACTLLVGKVARLRPSTNLIQKWTGEQIPLSIKSRIRERYDLPSCGIRLAGSARVNAKLSKRGRNL